MKKAISILAIACLMGSMMSFTVFAHGGHRNGNCAEQQPCHELCTVDGCDIVGLHQHDGVWVCSQTGHCGDVEVCTVQGCTESGLHEHNGVYYRSAGSGTVRGCGRRWDR